MTAKKIFIQNILKGANGYGMDKAKLIDSLATISDHLFSDLVYHLQRCAEKGGSKYFECKELIED